MNRGSTLASLLSARAAGRLGRATTLATLVCLALSGVAAAPAWAEPVSVVPPDAGPSNAAEEVVHSAPAVPTGGGASAPPQTAFTPAGLLSFADSLAASQDYYRAITEYQRFIHAFPTHPAAAAARLGVASAYRAGGKPLKAAARYLEVVSRHPATEEGRRAAFLAAEAYYGAFEYATAAAHYRSFVEEHPNAADRPLADYRVAWTHVGRHDFEGARAAMARVAADGPYGPAAAQLGRRLGQRDRVRHRAPWLAGTLSGVLPGAGHLYAGRPKDGLLALLVNGIFAFGTYEAVRQETYTAAALLGLFGVGFYLGNIFGAVNAAHRENKLALDRYVHDLVIELEPGAPGTPPAAARPPTGVSVGLLGFSGRW